MSRLIVILLCLTSAGLFYVYQEVEAVKIGYTIRKQEQIKTESLDRARSLKYNIARLKAPLDLEKRLLAEHILLESPKSWQTLMIAGKPGVNKPSGSRFWLERPFFVGRFFVGTAQAEAKE